VACIGWLVFCVYFWAQPPTPPMHASSVPRASRTLAFCPCHRCLGLLQWQNRTIAKHLDRQRLLERDLLGMPVPTQVLHARPPDHHQQPDGDVPYMDIDYENDYVGDNPIQYMPGWNDTVTVRIVCAGCSPVVTCMYTPTPCNDDLTRAIPPHHRITQTLARSRRSYTRSSNGKCDTTPRTRLPPGCGISEQACCQRRTLCVTSGN
jgi:hypothetical protein